MASEVLFAMVFVCGMVAGVLLIVVAMKQRSLQLEMLHRERMAMIERGLSPGVAGSVAAAGRRAGAPAATRWMTLGIVIVAFGLGLMTLISLAAEAPEIGVGVGGAIAIVGAAFLANGLLVRSTYSSSGLPPAGSPPSSSSPTFPDSTS